MERRLIGIATGEIKSALLVGEERVTPPGPHRQKTTARNGRQYSFHYRLRDQTQYQTIWSHGGRPADFFLPKCSIHMNSHNYLYRVPVWSSVNGPRFSVCAASLTSSRFVTIRHVSGDADLCCFDANPHFNSSPPKESKRCCQLPKSHRSCTQAPTLHSLKREASRLSFFQCRSTKQKGREEREFLSSGSPQGLSSPMLVVIFLILSLFTSLFSFFLNYLKCYLSNKWNLKGKKK